jgi:tetratricopeptide (TPR) repeat protein
MRTAILTAFLLAALVPPLSAESFASWMKDAEKAGRRGQHARAAGCYGQALRLWKKGDGRDAKLGALKAKAASHAAARQWPDAVRDLPEALRMSPGDKELLLQRGRAYATTGRPRQAVTDLTAAIGADIEYKEAYLERGRAYQKLGDMRFAKEDFGHACELGLKEACSLPAKPAPQRPAAAAPSSAPQAPADAGPIDAPSCFAFLNRCADDGDSYGSCVSRLEPCEKNPVKGCCPEACRKAFSKIQEEQGIGEAEAFRQVFRRGTPCLKRR